MNRLTPLTRARRCPEPAANLLEKTVFWQAMLGVVATAQEVSDFLTKSDTHDNN